MTDHLPPVSIGIPFFNAGGDLRDAIRSVFAQTHQDWELILIDDGSTDNSLEIARSIEDIRVRVFSDGKNKHLAARLNEIARLAKYDFVARMDADDLMHPTRIARQLQVLCDNPQLDMISTGVYSLDNENRPLGSRCVHPQHAITSKALLDGNCGILNAAVVAKRDWFLRNPFKESLPRAQDANLWLQAYSRDDLAVAILSEPLYFYREDDNVDEARILDAYKIMRHSIVADAKQRYRNRDRIRAYVKNLMKCAIVWTLARTSGLEQLRKRRITREISESERKEVMRVIEAIQKTELPLIKPVT